MKKQLFATIIVCICALAMVDFSRAADPNVYIEWAYANSPPDLAGFHLYVNDVQVEDFNVPSATSWSGPVILVDGSNVFEIAPYDTNGKELHKRSVAYTIDYDAPQSKVVITGVTVN